jgi:AAA family ATP:ADP antiporter
LYFAGFYVWLNAASLLVMAFGTERVIRRYGLRLALLSLPVALLFGATSLAVSLAMIVMYVLRVAEGAFRSALYEPGLERLYLRVPDDRFGILRPVLSGLIGRAGEGLGAVLVMLLALGMAPSLRTMVGFYLLVLLAWTGLVMALWQRVRPGPGQYAPLA